MSKRRTRPKSPEQIAMEAAQRRAEERESAKDPQRWGVNLQALAQQPDVEARGGRGKDVFAERKDVFGRLFSVGGLTQHQLDAVRRLEGDIAERRGEAGGNNRAEVVDCSGTKQVVTQRMIDAGRRVEEALLLTGFYSARLLVALIGDHEWRHTVAKVTGEKHTTAQGALVRTAAENLRLAYAAVDAGERRRA